MIFASRSTSSLIVGALLGASGLLPAKADDVVSGAIDGMPVRTISDRCAAFGHGFVTVGGGVCARTESHVRVYVGRGTIGSAPNNPWPPQAASNAALRSDTIVPGAIGSGAVSGTQIQHLRVRSGLEELDPFR